MTHAPGPLRFLTDMVGADHVVYGTDFPFDMAAGPLADQLDGTGLGGGDIGHDRGHERRRACSACRCRDDPPPAAGMIGRRSRA